MVTLDSVIAHIRAQNRELIAARLRATALEQVPDQVTTLPDPVLSAGYQPFPMLTAHGSQRSQFSLEQALPYPGKLSLRGEIAGLEARQASHEADALLEDLVFQAKEAYFELYRANEIERLVAGFEAELQGFEEAATIRYEVGRGPQQALLKAQLEKNLLSQRLHHIEGARRRAAEKLARLTNQPEGPRYFLTARPVLVSTEALDASELANAAAERRAEFAALQAAAERAAKLVELARKEALPDFGLRVTYYDIAASGVPASASGKDALAVGASVRIPLQRRRIRAGIEEARLRQAQIEAKQEALRTEYRTKIEDLLATLDHEARAIDEYEAVLLPQAASMVEATTNAYSTGVADFLELLDAERTVFSLRTGYVDAVTRYLVTVARLERVVGVQSIDELSPILTNSDPHQPILP